MYRDLRINKDWTVNYEILNTFVKNWWALSHEIKMWFSYNRWFRVLRPKKYLPYKKI